MRSISSTLKVTRTFASAFVLVLALSGCTSNFLRSLLSPNTTFINVPNSDQTGPLVLSRVISSAVGTGTLDLVGDGSGSIGMYCPTEDQAGEGSITGTSNCFCQYTYIENGSEKQILAETVYVENDLIRCSAGKLPATIPSVSVAIYIQSLQIASNIKQIRQPGSVLDPTDPLSFVRSERYQCRNLVFIPHIFAGLSIYDPIQSEDPRLSVPVNFYTTNFGSSFALYAEQNIRGWHCASNPTTTDLASGLDLAVYSKAPDAFGNIRIFPPQGSANDRSTFYLAKSATGIFTVPVNAFVAPGLVGGHESGGGDLVPPLGYAAEPIAQANGESCPDTVQIPSGFKWVKIWPFRASFEGRKYLASSEKDKMPTAYCYTNKFVNSQCSGFVQPLETKNLFSARLLTVAHGDKCVHFEPFGTASFPCDSNVAPGCTTQSSTEWYAGYEAFPLGSDIWRPANGALQTCTNADEYDFHICDDKNVPYDDQPISMDLDTAEQLHDYLFVVTPTTVMAEQMQKQGTTSVDMYLPYRFLPGDCKSMDPSNPEGPTDCLSSNRVTYDIKIHDIGDSSDPAGGTTSRPGIFPVCALQPTSQ